MRNATFRSLGFRASIRIRNGTDDLGRAPVIRPYLSGAVRRAARKPPLYDPTGGVFWTDPYVRRHVLHSHLSDETDDASRRSSRIDRSVRWIASQISGSPLMRLLDLGCGPGLYAHRFAEMGWRVTGIDVSRSSIRHARRSRPRGDISVRPPKFVLGDLRKFDTGVQYGAIVQIYGGFCVLSDVDRVRLLERIRSSLVDGGYFVFDAFTTKYTESHKEADGWYVEDRDGFWHSGVHLVLQKSVDYPSGVLLNRYTVIPSFGRIKSFNFWYRPFDTESVVALLARSGFDDMRVFGGLEGEAIEAGGEWIGVVCKVVR